LTGARFFTEIGGMLSYRVEVTDNLRRAATYADRILKGEKPSELPVQLAQEVRRPDALASCASNICASFP
jgi:ABC-type uncharacterized transport system substrate-binding protein